jgi:hypothetical protein
MKKQKSGQQFSKWRRCAFSAFDYRAHNPALRDRMFKFDPASQIQG